MASCDFCKDNPMNQLKSCVCGKASYCSKECQAKDWKTHKPSCPPFVIRESPGKGRGLFATRKIKEGQIILDEYPLLTVNDGTMSFSKFRACYYPNIDAETKAKILKLNDPSENLNELDTRTVEKMTSKNLRVMFWSDTSSEEMRKIFRIVSSNSAPICQKVELYGNDLEVGLFNNLSFINHSCVPNVARSWVMADFKRHQVRALKTIEKGEEILENYWDTEKFTYGSREFRREQLMEFGFLCECSECSLEGEALQDNERMRAKVRENEPKLEQLLVLGCEGSDSDIRESLKKAMKLAQQRVKLIQKLDLRSQFVTEMAKFSCLAAGARDIGVSCQNDPDVFQQEALKYAKMFGDRYIYLYNRLMPECQIYS